MSNILPTFSQYLVEKINGYQAKRDVWKEGTVQFGVNDDEGIFNGLNKGVPNEDEYINAILEKSK
jgi:hypothetical protein